MEIESRLQGDVLVLAPEGKMAIGAGEACVRAAIREALAAGQRKLLVDMKGVTMLDSSGVGELIGGYTSAVNKGGALKLARLTPRVREILVATQLTGILESYDDVPSALRSFASPRSPW